VRVIESKRHAHLRPTSLCAQRMAIRWHIGLKREWVWTTGFVDYAFVVRGVGIAIGSCTNVSLPSSVLSMHESSQWRCENTQGHSVSAMFRGRARISRRICLRRVDLQVSPAELIPSHLWFYKAVAKPVSQTASIGKGRAKGAKSKTGTDCSQLGNAH
jgi:hypothetical protein